MHELWPCQGQKSSSCPVMNRLLVIETRFLAPVGASFCFPPWLPFVAPGQDTGLGNLLPYESSSSIQLSRRSSVSAPDSWEPHGGERQPGHPRSSPHFHYHVQEKRRAHNERSSLGMPRRSKTAWKKRLRWKLKKEKWQQSPDRCWCCCVGRASSSPGPWSYWRGAHTLRLILIEINFTSTIFCKVLQLIENQMKLL